MQVETPRQDIKALRRRVKVKRAKLLAAARARSEDCAEYVMTDEKTRQPIRLAPFHRVWHALVRENSRCEIIAPVEHGKSQFAVSMLLHLLGSDPRRRCAVLGNTVEQAEKLVGAVRVHIESNAKLREVFPGLVPSPNPGDKWTQRAITVERDTISKDASVAAFGAYGPINDMRVDVLVVDDILDFDNTRTLEQRAKLLEWFDSTVINRLTDNAVVIFIGTPWHPDDMLFELQKRGWACWHEGAVANPDDHPSKWHMLWPDRWPIARMLERRKQLGGAQSSSFIRKLLCRVRLDANARFKAAWWDRACALGRNQLFVAEQPKAPGGVRRLPCFTGVDLGIGKKQESGKTVIFTIAIDDRERRVIVDIESGHWTAPEIIMRLEYVYKRYQSSILVESNGAQEFIVQMASQRFPIDGRPTGNNKHHEEFGVEALAVELQNQQWVVPSGPVGSPLHPELEMLRSGLLYYNAAQHTADHLIGMWLAKEAARMFRQPRQHSYDGLSR